MEHWQRLAPGATAPGEEARRRVHVRRSSLASKSYPPGTVDHGINFSFAKRPLDPLVLTGMATVSEQLRQARERQRLDIYQVAEITKIKTDHLRALESGNFEIFSAPVYIRGFIRTYATMLKLDPAHLLKELELELGHAKVREAAPLTKAKRGPVDFAMLQLSRLNWRTAVVSVAILAFLALAASLIRNRLSRPTDPLKELTPSLYRPNPSRSGETLPLPAPAPVPSNPRR